MDLLTRLSVSLLRVCKVTRSQSIAIVAGSIILGLIRSMNQKERFKGSTITLVDYVKKGIVNANASLSERQELANACKISMEQLLDQFRGTDIVILQIAIFVESLSFSFEKELTDFYGNEYINIMSRFTIKQFMDSKTARESYLLSDQLRDNIRKIVFDNMKESGDEEDSNRV